jgi:hypothetical protein
MQAKPSGAAGVGHEAELSTAVADAAGVHDEQRVALGGPVAMLVGRAEDAAAAVGRDLDQDRMASGPLRQVEVPLESDAAGQRDRHHCCAIGDRARWRGGIGVTRCVGQGRRGDEDRQRERCDRTEQGSTHHRCRSSVVQRTAKAFSTT